MESPDPSVRKPSLFVGGFVGFLVAALVAGVVCWILAIRSGDFDNQQAFKLFAFIAGPGTFEGYRFAARKRKRLGVNEESDEWQQFFGSATFCALAAVVLIGSLVVSVLESLLFDLIYGAAWLQSR